MQTYYGTKKILAQPMSLGAYNQYRGWTLPADEDFTTPGYLVEYLDSPKPGIHPNHDNYISWSPADVFENAYQPTFALSFGHAVMAAKEGKRIARAGWNGKGMFLYFVPANLYPASRNTGGSMIGYYEDDMVPYREYLAMKTAQNDVVPWMASITDYMADDWMIVD